MEIIYKENYFEIPNNIYERRFFNKDGSGATIYSLFVNNKQLILKVFPEKYIDTFNAEKNHYFLIKNILLNKPYFYSFFIKYHAIVKYNNEYIFFMDKLDNLYESIKEEKYKKNILFQILTILYIMNNNYNIYFNDLFADKSIKNIMIKKKSYTQRLEYHIDNSKHHLFIDHYQIIFIDYGFINNYPGFNTIRYMNKYFNNLFINNIISEIIITIYFFLKKDKKKYDLLLSFITTDNIFYVKKNFDILFLTHFYNNIHLFINDII